MGVPEAWAALWGGDGDKKAPEATTTPATQPTATASTEAAAKAPEALKEAPTDLPIILKDFILKLGIRIGEQKSIDMQNAVNASILGQLLSDEKTLLTHSFPPEVLDKAFEESITNDDVEALRKLEWVTGSIGTNIPELRRLCLNEFFEKLKAAEADEVDKKAQEAVATKNKPEFTTWVESHVAKLEGRTDLTDDEKSKLAALKEKVTAYQTAEDAKTDGSGYADWETKKAEFDKEFQPIFEAYKAEAIAKLTAEKVDTVALSAITDCDGFIATLEATIDAGKKGTGKLIAEAQNKGSLDGVLTEFGMQPADIEAFRTAHPVLYFVVGLIFSAGLSPQFITDPLFKKMSENKLPDREICLDLNSESLKWKMKNHEATDTVWNDHKANRAKAETWLSTTTEYPEIKRTYSPTLNDGILNSLLDSEYTVGSFKTLGSKGDNPDALEETDLPKDYVASFPFVKALHETITAKEGNNTTNDTKTLSEYIATVLAQQEEAPLVAKKDEPVAPATA